MRFLTFCKTYTLCFRVVGAIFFRFARICSPTDRRCAQMPFGVMGTIPQVAPSVRQIADFWHAECVSMRAVCTGIARLPWAMRYLDILPLGCLADGKMLHCYMLHVTISTFRMSAPSFGSLNLGGVKNI